VHRYRKDVLHEDGEYAVTCSFFGDGTCNVGQFYECLNMAALYKLPHIFVVENNKWAIGMSHARSTSSTAGDEYPYIYKKGPAFGMPSVYVDGMDVVKVRAVAKEAIERARRGEGPTLIEAETYRFRGHSLADPDELRSKDEKAAYAVRIHRSQCWSSFWGWGLHYLVCISNTLGSRIVGGSALG
jgi:pyruvate dehydrogenase E1 component alpha subunit